ncbi:thioredoxin domain-containing protein [Thalassobacillus hwangdonensis]|uniref:Thioredoxin domain-containing protein n=1 Tax=Thalassobacillus hwangdonensis TaxID=546108 RepID=A0ABW3KY06_9BACI
MAKIILPILSIAILLTACLPGHEKVNIITFQPDDLEVHLYSEMEEKESEQAYLDALLDMKQKLSDKEIQFVQKTISKKNVQADVKQFPTLIIFKDGKRITSISGHTDKNQIVDQLLTTIQK